MLDPTNGLAAGDPARMAAAIIKSVEVQPPPLRLMLGSQALESMVNTLQKRIADFEAQKDVAESTDYPMVESRVPNDECRMTNAGGRMPNAAGAQHYSALVSTFETAPLRVPRFRRGTRQAA